MIELKVVGAIVLCAVMCAHFNTSLHKMCDLMMKREYQQQLQEFNAHVESVRMERDASRRAQADTLESTVIVTDRADK